MTQREKFFETVGILVEAYLNDTLIHEDPCGCSGGNIIAKKLGAKVIIERTEYGVEMAIWSDVNADGYDWFQRVKMGKIPFGDPEKGERDINLTGYSVKEFSAIEQAFESVISFHVNGHRNVDIRLDHDGYKGLMEVCNVLASIHGINLEERESAKLLFKKESV